MTDTEALRRAIDWVKRGVFLAARKEGPAWNPRHGVPGDIVLDAAERYLALAEGDEAVAKAGQNAIIDIAVMESLPTWMSKTLARQMAQAVLAAITEEGGDMAGSYNHAVDDAGRLRNPATMSIATETQGDAYETIEEMYGMIWWLAGGNGGRVAEARQHWMEGIGFSPGRQEEQ